MKKINWLLEKNIFANEDNLKEAIKNNGHNVHIFEYIPILCDIKKLPFKDTDTVIFYGSLNAAKVIKRKFKFFPGVIGTFDLYNCLIYYQFLYPHLLNKKCEILPYKYLLSEKKKLFDNFGEDDTIFIRPNSSMKLFNGSLVTKDEFEDKVINEFQLYDNLDPNELIIVSNPKPIKNEWRFIVSGKEIISGSQYKENRKHKESPWIHTDAIEFLNKVLFHTSYDPDYVWVIDICQLENDKFYVLETGSFSCSGLYANNLDKVVNGVSKIIYELY